MSTYITQEQIQRWLDSLSWYRRILYRAALQSLLRFMQKHLHEKE